MDDGSDRTTAVDGAAPATPNEHLLKLRDGRRLCYAEYGDPAGSPLFLFHGMPGSRLVWSGDTHSSALRHGIRVIAPDRPGFGRSDFQPYRRLLDWPVDVAQLADSLGYEKFAVAGASSGGCHCLACAYALPDRVAVAGVVSGFAPYDAPALLAEAGILARLELAIYHRVPAALVSAGTAAVDGVWPTLPDWLAGRFGPQHTPSWMGADIQRRVQETVRECVHDGLRGWAHETWMVVQPWRFNLEDIRVPVHLWHGEGDRECPIEMARYNASRIPGCNATFYPGEGHQRRPGDWDEIIAALKI